jgi:hypothetical protein
MHHQQSRTHCQFHNWAIIDNEEDTADQHEKPTAEFLCWHHKLNHVSATKMLSMAKRSLLPKKLAKCQIPANLHQLLVWGSHQRTMENQAKGWSTRWKTLNSLRAGTVHQHQSVLGVQHSRFHCPNQGLVHQEKYKVATRIFVDHFSSGLSYIHLLKSTNADETLKSKAVLWEVYLQVQGPRQQLSNANKNGRFAEKKFMAAGKELGQTITF